MTALNVSVGCPQCGNKITIDLVACKTGTKIFCTQCKTLINLSFDGPTFGELIEGVKVTIAEEFRKAGIDVDVR